VGSDQNAKTNIAYEIFRIYYRIMTHQIDQIVPLLRISFKNSWTKL